MIIFNNLRLKVKTHSIGKALKKKRRYKIKIKFYPYIKDQNDILI